VKDGREAWIEGPDRRVASHVADTWHIDKREDMWSDRVDRVKMASVEVERGAQRTWQFGRSRTAVTSVGPGLMVWASKPLADGLRVWASKSGRRFRGQGCQKDGTWRHRGGCVDARLPMRRRGGRRIKVEPRVDENSPRAN